METTSPNDQNKEVEDLQALIDEEKAIAQQTVGYELRLKERHGGKLGDAQQAEFDDEYYEASVNADELTKERNRLLGKTAVEAPSNKSALDAERQQLADQDEQTLHTLGSTRRDDAESYAVDKHGVRLLPREIAEIQGGDAQDAKK